MSSKKINRAEFLEMLLPSLFLSFTFFLFGPVELYISNITEFWFCFGDVLLEGILFLFVDGDCYSSLRSGEFCKNRLWSFRRTSDPLGKLYVGGYLEYIAVDSLYCFTVHRASFV